VHKTKKKTKTAYVVVLNRQAMKLLERIKKRHIAAGIESEFIFVNDGGRGSIDRGRPISRNSIRVFLKNSLGRRDITLHGFRTTFGDWSVEAGYDERDSEMALGHVIGTPVRNIYKRNAKRIEARRPMMQAWADFLDRTEPLPASVIPFKKAERQ
jgi:integrase